MFSTPGARDVFVNYDLGYYAQDSWTMKRLTLNLGLRVDNFRSMYEESANPPGRFVPGAILPGAAQHPELEQRPRAAAQRRRTTCSATAERR